MHNRNLLKGSAVRSSVAIQLLTGWLKGMHWHWFHLHILSTSKTNWHVCHGIKWSQISLQTARSMLWSCLPLVDKIPSPKTWGLRGRFETLTHIHTHTLARWKRMKRRGHDFQHTYQFHVNSHWNAGLSRSLSHKSFFPPFLFLICSSFSQWIWLLDMIYWMTCRLCEPVRSGLSVVWRHIMRFAITTNSTTTGSLRKNWETVLNHDALL